MSANKILFVVDGGQFAHCNILEIDVNEFDRLTKHSTRPQNILLLLMLYGKFNLDALPTALECFAAGEFNVMFLQSLTE
jgi:hypothetical protein